MKKSYIVLLSITALIIIYFLYRSFFVHEQVRAVEIHRGNLKTVVYATGSVTADSLATLRSEAGGIVTFIKPKEGDVVRTGELLLKTNQSDQKLKYEQAENDLESAKINLSEKELNLKRNRALIESKSITQKEMDDAKNEYDLAKLQVDQAQLELDIAKEALRKTEVKAPFNGRIINVAANLGDNLTPNAECFTILAPPSILIRGDVDEQDVSLLRPGLNSIVAFDAYPDKKFEGNLYRIVPKTDLATKTTSIYVKLKSRPDNLFIGMTATINVLAGELQNVLIVPRTCIIQKQEEQFVFVINSDNELKSEKITTGNSEGKYAELTSGNLSEGTLLVEQPKESYRDGTKVEVVK